MLYTGSEQNSKERIILLGYVSEHQKFFDAHSDSYINFNRLSGYSNYIAPDKYYRNLREGFLKHLSSIYLEAIHRYPNNVKLRISYAYYLNDIMKLKNHALSICYSIEFLDKNFLDGYHFWKQKMELESFDNNEDIQYVTGNQVISDLKVKDNIFLISSQEDLMVKKKITIRKRQQYRRMVKETIILYSDLWRELMEDTPDSIKLRQSLLAFYEHSQKCDSFWKRYQNYFVRSSHAMFDHGIYNIVIKNQEKEGLH